MGTDRPFEQARNFGHGDPGPDDARAPWTGPEPEIDAVAELEETAKTLIRQYLAVHGDWREVTVTSQFSNGHSWEFTPCACDICQRAVQFVGHPSTPNG